MQGLAPQPVQRRLTATRYSLIWTNSDTTGPLPQLLPHMSTQHDIFISHSSKDNPLAEEHEYPLNLGNKEFWGQYLAYV